MSEPEDPRPVPHSSKACRNLFGPVDGEQLRRDCDALLAGCLQEARERWNFDFATETPLEGSFAWERVRGLGLPRLYLSPGTAQRPEDGRLGLPRACTLAPRSPEQPEESPGGPAASQGRKRRQTSLTDFYHSKRRLIFSRRKP